ncbi:Group 4 capsule polysaccharide lipoprotein gfcB, YjbF [Yoonia tamlensis]|uniref:Group 4 capsule polysaccharide lipoprotein gfcB, YjbF n=1 Tax=Yoonia tamlensis TaxID=390270 RepID=A0A1I6HM77_9RHOB|nr:YjbF family lipoprotein [Yoonia tamlensis]SFR55555.1 Group 4 capsule polysaccharide lipoprotein gfcB, YjbF [Yoonia tamlensis]
MTYLLKTGAALGAFLALASCGSLGQSGIGARITGMITGQEAAPAAPENALVPAEEMLANPGKYVRVNIRDQGAWVSLMQVAQNGARTTWIGQSNISMTFENGLLVATRGLPRDLLGSDVTQSWDAITNGGGSAERRQDYITDQDGISAVLLQCSIESEGSEQITREAITFETTRFKEVCTGDALTFTNIYWVGRQNSIIRSLQAVSPDAGYLQIDVF